MAAEFTKAELDAISQALDELRDDLEDDGDESFGPLLDAIESAHNKVLAEIVRLRRGD